MVGAEYFLDQRPDSHSDYIMDNATFNKCFSGMLAAEGEAEGAVDGNQTSEFSPWDGEMNPECDLSKLYPFMQSVEADGDVLTQPLYVAIIVTLNVVVILLGVMGNTLVVITVIKTKQLWNATNIFIANLAVADILVCVFDLPLNAYYVITGDWAFGWALCHVIPMAFAVVVYTSTLTLTMIAVDRYVLIVFPMVSRMSLRTALLLVLVIGLVSVAVASPIAVYAQYSDFKDPLLNYRARVCSETWPSTGRRRLYTVLTLVFQFFFPLVIIAVLYALIFRRVSGRVRGRGARARTKTTKMLVAVVTVFAVTWIPFHLFSLMFEFRQDLIRGNRFYKFTDSLLRVLAMSSSCINPLLYGWLNDNYRKAFLSIMRRPMASPSGIHREESEDVTRICRRGHSISPVTKLYGGHASSGNGNGKTRTPAPRGGQHVQEESVPLRPVEPPTDSVDAIDHVTVHCSDNNNTSPALTSHVVSQVNGQCTSKVTDV